MNKEKISSQEIIDLVASKASVSKRAAEEFLKVMIATIEDALIAGEAVKIKGFGTFKLQWNEPRKSVNVQTGEEIILEGYQKVAFTPEASLKELVNEPFAHLEPVLLDGDNNFVIEEKPEEVALDPLRIFTEQASEIKDLLSEIQALSPVRSLDEEATLHAEYVVEAQSAVVDSDVLESPEASLEDTDEELVISDYVFEDDLIEEQVAEGDVVSEVLSEPELELVPELESSIAVVSETANQVEPEIVELPEVEAPVAVEELLELEAKAVESVKEEQTSEIEFTPFLDGIKPKKRFQKWLWAAVLLLLLSGAGLYLFFPPVKVMGDYIWSQASVEVVCMKNSVVNTISGWFTSKPKPSPKVVETVVVPKDTSAVDTVEAAEPIDTLQQLFDNPRVYEEFIASEQINNGSRLTVMSKKYYGNKDFWVYIYEANKERVKNPDHIEMGTLIRIPRLNPKLIDASNPRCIEKARELHDIYVKNKSEKTTY
jgi:nucleoid DNA-binding protein/DnaJ-domain-containing protein 1